jgi:curved DNA-binding protein CbpA
MTDYFALLEQPRAPSLDLAALKEAFHRKTLKQHPDTKQAGTEDQFALLNEAYQVLRDPKRRLQHLLELQGGGAAAGQQTIPGDLQELFLQIGATIQRAKSILEQLGAATTALSRSILKPKAIDAQREVETLRGIVRDRTQSAEQELRQINATQIDALSALHLKFAYLGRWSAQLDELAFQLSAL